ncbi:TetR/AcrR family transcriptional regulator [Actinoplanes sp. NPDC051411]|uniref:TetR/AcrR family transcriptional regulator n=1 Tax=Actinoplanes sp. NPDC051411 TaxID=3155522 RepID=UPI003415D453
MSTTTRLTRKGQATRERILQAAADLILRNGVAGTQIDDVRKAAGVSGSQMTHYFHDKHHLIADVVAWQAQANLDNHRLPVVGGLDSFASLREWARLLLERQEQLAYVGGCMFGSLAGQLVESDPDIRAGLADGFERLLELFRAGLTAMRERGDLRADADPEQLALVLVTAMQGGLLLTQTLRRPDPLRNALDAAITHVETFAPAPR